MRFTSLIFLSTFLLTINNIADAEVTQGAMLSNSCSACHGTDGKSPGSMPSLYGKSVKYITESLKEFRSGSKPSTVMGRHAKGYTDEEIKLIAEYFAGLK